MSKRMIAVAVVLLGFAGQAMAASGVRIDQWPSDDANNQTATMLIDTVSVTENRLRVSLGGAATVIAISDSIPNSYSTTSFGNPAAAYLATKQVLPFTAMGYTSAGIRSIRVCSKNGSATDYAFVSFSLTLSGHGAAAAAWTGADQVTGPSGTCPCWDYPLRNGDYSGTIWWGVATDTIGVTALDVRVGGVK